jgi:hypothetical protein
MDCLRIYAASIVCTVWVVVLVAGAQPERTLLPAVIALALALGVSVHKYLDEVRHRSQRRRHP